MNIELALQSCAGCKRPMTTRDLRCPRCGHDYNTEARADETVTDCTHPARRLFDGPRVPMAYGAAPTQICGGCGKWRTNLHKHGGEWRSDSLVDAAKATPEKEES